MHIRGGLGASLRLGGLPGAEVGEQRHLMWPEVLEASYCAILRYYRCDTPHCATLCKRRYHSPKIVRHPPWYLVFTQAHLCDAPFATYRAIVVRYPIKTSTKEFCDTIATNIARYESIAAGPLSQRFPSEAFIFLLSGR